MMPILRRALDKKKLIIFTIIGIIIIGFLAYSTYAITVDKTASTETITEGTESN